MYKSHKKRDNWKLNSEKYIRNGAMADARTFFAFIISTKITIKLVYH